MEVVQLGNICLASMSIKGKRNKTVAVCSQRELTHFLSMRVFFFKELKGPEFMTGPQGGKEGIRQKQHNLRRSKPAGVP